MSLLPMGIAQLEQDVHRRIGLASATAADITKAHLDEPGSGIHWPWNPYRSSARGEYPARQYGPLQDSVGHAETGLGKFVVGSINKPPPEAVILEFSPEFMGGRPWLSKSLEDAQTHTEMNKAAQGGG